MVTISIGGSKVWETGWEAIRLAIAAFLIPVAFVLNTGLLMIGEPSKIILAVTTATVGAILLACGVRGYALWPLNPVPRVLIAAAGLMCTAPGLHFALAGSTIVTLVAATHKLRTL